MRNQDGREGTSKDTEGPEESTTGPNPEILSTASWDTGIETAGTLPLLVRHLYQTSGFFSGSFHIGINDRRTHLM